MRPLPRFIQYLFVVLALVGLVDSLYLYASHVRGTSLACGALTGCDIVAASSYSEIHGIPLALLGVIFYAGMLVLAAALFSHDKKTIRLSIVLGSIIGALASLWFEYVQLVLIGAWCLYCLGSALISWSIMILSYVYIWKAGKDASVAL